MAVWICFCLLFLTGPDPGISTAHYAQKPAQADRGTATPGVITQVRARAEDALDPGLPPDAAALLQGMALGDASHMSSAAKEEFRRASLTHVVAASGQNIALLLALVLPALGLLGMGLRPRLAIAVGLVVLYVPLAGGGAPIRRAAVMALVGLAGRVRGSQADAWHALGVAGTVTLLADRSSSASLGWQLSFAAVAGMLALGPPVKNRLESMRVPPVLAEVAAATISATIATAPLIAWKVGRLSLVGIPANLLAAPAVAPAMWLGITAAAVGQVSTSVAAPLAMLAAIPVSSVLEVAHAMASPSWASVGWHPSGALAAVLLILTVFGPLAIGHGRKAA